MRSLLKRILPALFFWIIFAVVILEIPYPTSLVQSPILPLIAFFGSIFFSISLTLNIFLKNIPSSFSLALGIILLLTLNALDLLNLVTGLLVIVSCGLFVSYFRKIKKANLTKLPKAPKLTKRI